MQQGVLLSQDRMLHCLSIVGRTFMTALPRTLVANCTCCFHWLT